MTTEDAANADGVLAAIAFGRPCASALFTIALPQIGDRELVEVWRTNDRVTRGSHGVIAYAATEQLVLGGLSIDAGDVEAAGATAFDAIIDFARASGHANLLRVWNHVGEINGVDENGVDDKGANDKGVSEKGSNNRAAGERTERYRSFCAGRYEAFARHGYALRADLPAASAVGMRGHQYAAYFLASRTPGMQVENPWQVSAYDYPPQYGRRSPSFSRATVLRGDGESLLFLAGTASIVGHETIHAGNVARQVEETIRNIARVLEAAGGTLSDLTLAKAYVRQPADRDAVAASLAAALGDTPVLYLQADVCRADLLVEVEGMARLSPATARLST